MGCFHSRFSCSSEPKWTIVHSPSFETLQGFVDVPLMELCHVGVHFWIVVPDVSLCAPIWDGAEPEWG